MEKVGLISLCLMVFCTMVGLNYSSGRFGFSAFMLAVLGLCGHCQCASESEALVLDHSLLTFVSIFRGEYHIAGRDGRRARFREGKVRI